MTASPTASSLTFGIRDWFAWKPGLETRADWLRRAGQASTTIGRDIEWENKATPLLPMMTRRRLSAFDQKVIGAALAIPAAEHARYVFASRHGEFATTMRILEDLHQRSAPSPADFSMSVHHALAGLLSINTGNKAGHTTISAGRDTFGYGMLEAAALVSEGSEQSVLLVSYDEPLPDVYQTFKEPDEDHLPLIVALDIVADATTDHRFSLDLAAHENASDEPTRAEIAEAMTIPLGQRFLDFFMSDRPQAVLTGETMSWILRRAA